MMKAYGKKTWLIGDAYWDSHSNGIYPSHESICVLNTS
ncbi:MAG: sensory rhodopsin transducer, partial [Clostridia bacterium]|nr:sensory rhodopsin transducer [Clostridia bacterium]